MCYRGNLPKRRSEKAAGGWSAAFPNGKTGRKTVLKAIDNISSESLEILGYKQKSYYETLKDEQKEFRNMLSRIDNVSIENITIKTDELNSSQDFAKAGNALASSLQEALRQRGIITNLKR